MMAPTRPELPLQNKIRDELIRAVESKESRKLQARQQGRFTLWYGLGMFGLVGWSVATPILVGVAIGFYIDKHWPGPISWTLTLLFSGLAVGCLTAWYWVKRESHRS